MHTVLPSPSAHSGVPYLRKRSRSLIQVPGAFSCVAAMWSPLCQSSMVLSPFSAKATWSCVHSPTPPTISYTCQHSSIPPALLGCHSKSGQVWPLVMEPMFSKLSHRRRNQGDLPPSYISVEVTSIPLAQSMVKLFNICMKPVKGYGYVKLPFQRIAAQLRLCKTALNGPAPCVLSPSSGLWG